MQAFLYLSEMHNISAFDFT